ncbi:hypothetical protein J5N97_008678 [Dioscorea zingiberensis]|uniref:GIR1-like zinc ribbon domain-containing protein n=1 Tax=Dioscorea zingiberensis TaxID=325984 RepID=A0A9D5CXX4_9LILI|nr:hypothetical protein J5N97_008678 [Dioscorea zingiberensis]
MKDEVEGKRNREFITRDLLGGCDLGSEVPAGWNHRLDLLTGNAYLERRGSDPLHRQLQDLNLPPPEPIATSSPALPEVSTALDLKLVAPLAAEYQSVCTLEKVRYALERAGRESRGRRRGLDGSPSPSSSTTSSSVKRRIWDDDEGVDGSDSSEGTAMMAAGCPGCLLYVLISRGNPRCPRCFSHVPVPVIPKRLKLDLNSVSP